MKYWIKSLSVVLAVTLAACSQPATTTPPAPPPPPGPSSLPAPQNVRVEAGNASATVSWDAMNDPKVTGYNVYRDGTKANTAPITASSAAVVPQRVGSLAASRLSFQVKGLENGKRYNFAVTTVEGDKESNSSSQFGTKPDAEVGKVKYLVEGSDLGDQYQNLRISKAGVTFSSATVTVNGTAIPFANIGYPGYHGTLASALPVGGAVNLSATVPEGSITANDTVPESPVLVSPANASIIDVSSPVVVTWTSGSDPDRFLVSATYSCGPVCGTGQSFDAPGSARSFTVPANQLPAGTAVKIRVYAYNDGTETFTGPFEVGSKLSIRNGNEAGHDVKTQKGAVQQKPDLIVTYASIAGTGSCTPFTAVLKVKATVKNIGTASSPANSNGVVGAIEADPYNWGNGIGTPDIAPGAEATVNFDIFYLVDHPTHMAGTHFFKVNLNSGNWIDELDTTNNDYGSLEVKLAACAQSSPTYQGIDLKITSASITPAQTCKPYEPILWVKATVENVGSLASPERLDVGVVGALNANGSGWGNGVGTPALAPGDATTVSFPIYYLIANPTSMPGSQQFNLTVNSGGWIANENAANNTFGAVNVTIPQALCAPTSSARKLALVHGADTGTAGGFKVGLETKGFLVTLVPISGLSAGSTSSLQAYDAILIDDRSGNLNTWEGSSEVITAIGNANRPIIGLGEGGYAFLGKRSSPIGWPNAWHGPASGQTITPNHPALSGPLPVGTAGGRVAISSGNINSVGVYFASAVAGLERIGSEEGSETHSAVVIERPAKQAIWGYSEPNLTGDGWSLFSNVINNLIGP